MDRTHCARCRTLSLRYFYSSPVYQLVLLVWAQSLEKAEQSTSLWSSAMLRRRWTAAVSCLQWTEPYNSSIMTLPYSLATTFNVHCWALGYVRKSLTQSQRSWFNGCTCIHHVCKFYSRELSRVRTCYIVLQYSWASQCSAHWPPGMAVRAEITFRASNCHSKHIII